MKTEQPLNIGDDVPVLTEVVTPGNAPPPEATIAAIQAELSARTLKLAEELLHSAARDMEAVLLERVRDQLKSALPGIIDETLRASFKTLK
jgi:hypothetical protein